LPAVFAENLSVFRDGGWALKSVNFSAEIGEFVSVLGPNGGGKSTFIKALAGLCKPTNGKALIFGKTPVESAKFIGYTPQDTAHNLDFPITAIEIVKMAFLAEKASKKKAFEALKMLGAEALAEKKVAALSGGERQRVFLARAIAADVKVLLLDEPTSGIDIDGETLIAEVLSDLKKTRAIVCVSHDKEKLLKISDRAVFLDKKIRNA
jgi:zinc transport system ATP-binding protein